MMKRITGLLLALALVLTTVSAALADVTFTTKYFTLSLPQGWIIETENLDPEEGMESLGFAGSPEEPGLVIAAYLQYDEESAGTSLWNASDADLDAYAKLVMEDFRDDNPEYLGTVKANNNIPFVLIKGRDADGEYLYADTLTNGYYIMIEAFVADEKKYYPLTDEAVEQFKSILATFAPVT
jgi:hypothetical protein